ncbi:DUF2071 domain-containing protein [Novosphingobium sp. 9]|uniref:DUF2071 domain-containing protein n=1 Tax=Novosphingobium sp. 9 TaxID=2025349 RepID=UPI0021B5102F|nr:DUF2071 domain-containing protein [Novosphingobium sp. 9]
MPEQGLRGGEGRLLPLRFASPREGLFGRIETCLANHEGLRRIRRAFTSRLPFPKLVSDVRDVIYASWVVPVDRLADVIPPGVTIRSVDGHAILTVLTYVHGHFGPALAGPLRGLFPSPKQSNWRLYVQRIGGQEPAVETVLFLCNAFDSDLYALGTRLFSDAMLSHRAVNFGHRRDGLDWISGAASGGGSAPDWHLRGRDTEHRILPAEFAPFFGGYDEALAQLTLQDEAIAPLEKPGNLAFAGIDLPINLDSIIPMQALDWRPGAFARALGLDAMPFCFRVPAVRFTALWERI